MAKPTYRIDPAELDNRQDFDFLVMSADHLEESLAVLRESFFPWETVHKLVRAVDNPASISELEKLCRKTFQDGISVIAKDKTTDRIVAVALNKLQEKPLPGKPGAFDQIAATFKEPESLAVMDFMIKVDGKVDLFSKYNTTILFELMFLGTLPEYCGRHIAQDLCKVCLQVASQTPAAAVNTLATSEWTERICKSLGFELLHQEYYSSFRTPDGVKYSDILGEDKSCTLRAYALTPPSTKL